MKILHRVIICVGLGFLCSCATRNSNPPQLPADVAMNKDAGRGNLLIVMLRLESGEELPFVLDTGTTVICLDKSLESKLGKRRGRGKMWHDGKIISPDLYAVPKLYLGSTPLVTSGKVAYILDLKPISIRSGHHIMGVLGMDCLRHYCIQLDFEAGKVRFLRGGTVDNAQVGEAFPLTYKSGCPVIHRDGLTGVTNADWIVDTGNAHDGDLTRGLFRLETQKHVLRITGGLTNDNQSGKAWLPNCTWNSESYTNLWIGSGSGMNSIGLRFLARHLVTFDFPQQTLYLKQTGSFPLTDENMEETAKLIKNLEEKDQLPGWSKNDAGMIELEAHPDFKTYDFRKDGVSSTCHYRVVRTPDGNSWKLQKAWRTDADGKMLEEYPVP
jgi:hypothetical protein